MALADFNEDRPPNGWMRQAQRLAGAHTAFGMKASAVAEQVRKQRDTGQSPNLTERAAERATAAEARQAELTRELELALARVSGMEQRIANEQALREDAAQQRETLREQNAEATARIAALEAELAAEQSGKGLQENEIESLRNSLDLAISENSRMAARVDLAESLLSESRVQTESLRAEAVTADVQRIRTVDVAHRADEQRQTELRKLQNDLAAMTARARTAETLLADSRECLVMRIAESEKLACNLVEATDANCEADRMLDELQALLRTKEQQIAEIEQSRQTLMTRAQKLLENCQGREQALARAEEKIRLLDQWVVRLEAETRRSLEETRNAVALALPQFKTQSTQVSTPKVAAPQVSAPQIGAPQVSTPAEDPREARRRQWMELAQQLAKLDLKRQLPGPVRVTSTPAPLTGTIAC